MNFIQRAQQHHAKHPRRIVLPESSDDRILQAAVAAAEQNIAQIVVLGNSADVDAQLAGLGLTAAGIRIIDPRHSDNLSRYAEALYLQRKHKGLSRDQADALVLEPTYYANCMVLCGDADGCVAGAQLTSATVVRTALQVIGTCDANARLSSFLILMGAELTEPVIFADCAININPDAAELADIAQQSAQSARALFGTEPNLAMLSFSTHGSADHPDADKVREATQILAEQQPSLKLIGEIQFDAALSSAVRQTKWPDAANTEAANVFIFPNLDAGNIGYKIAERIGGAVAIGPILQGLAKPVNDLSRGASTEAIINTIAVTALQV